MDHAHDLEAMLTELCARHFPGCAEVEIRWGRWPGSGKHRSIRFGVYQPEQRRIRIHPALNHPRVPHYFVEFIIYHELLHHVLPAVRVNGRYQIHSAAFRARERAFPRYAEAIAWRKRHLRTLLTSRRPAPP